MKTQWRPHIGFLVFFALDLFFVLAAIFNEAEMLFLQPENGSPLLETFVYDGYVDWAMIFLYSSLCLGWLFSIVTDLGGLLRIRMLVLAVLPATFLLFVASAIDLYLQVELISYGEPDFRLLLFAVGRFIYAPVYLIVCGFAFFTGLSRPKIDGVA